MSDHTDVGGSNQDGSNQDGNHFDEVDAVRRFPSEEEWLDLPLPESFGEGSDQMPIDRMPIDRMPIDQAGVPATGAGFVERVLQAQKDEQQLDEQIAELDRLLPSQLLNQFAPPTPSDSFVAETTAKVQQDRRQRWQEMLARYVAPEPSDAFVSRTLEALSTSGQEAAGDGESRRGSSGRPGAGRTASGRRKAGSRDAGHRKAGKGRSGRPRSAGQAEAAPVPWTRRNGPVFALVAAAAALLLWLSLSKPERAPLEIRLAQLASPAAARTDSLSPMGAILAQVADDSEPFAMFDEPADGLWLTSSVRSNGEELR